VLADVQLAVSDFVPLAIGFFGLATGYLIYGPEELLGVPTRDRAVDLTTGLWGVFMPGLMQLITGTYIFIGLAWFHTFREKPLYMAGVAFTAYGVHWFALGIARMFGGDPRPNGFMAVSFIALSVLGALVFFKAGDWPVGVLFVGLTGVYVSELFASLARRTPPTATAPQEPKGSTPTPLGEIGERTLGLFHVATGIWLLYLTWAITVNTALGWHWRV
jgi:hypothetical protein